MKEKINKLWHSMVFKRWLFFFTRNNPIHTNRYYYRFIEIVGSERYLSSPLVRNEWDGARCSFDKMYGLVAEWRKSFDILNGEEPQYTEFGDRLDSLISKRITDLKSRLDEIFNGVIPLAKDSDENEGKTLLEKYIDIKNSILDVERTVKTENADKSQTVVLSKKINHIEELEVLYNDLVGFYVFIGDLENKNRKKAEGKEKSDAGNGSEGEKEDKNPDDKKE